MVDMTLPRDRIVPIGRTKAKPIDQADVGLSTWMDFTTQSTYSLDLGKSDQGGIFGIPRSIFINNADNPTELVISSTGTQFLFAAPANSTGYYKLDSINTSAQLNFFSVGGATAPVRVIVYNYDIPPNVWYKFGVFDSTKPLQVFGTLVDGGSLVTDTHPAPIKIAGIDRATGLIHILSVDATGILNISAASLPLPTGAATATLQGVIANDILALTAVMGAPFQAGGALGAGAAIIGKVGIDQTAPGTTNGVEEDGRPFLNISTNATSVVKAGAGNLHTITINTKGVTNTATIYDNTAASGTKIATIDTTLGQATFTFDIKFSTGLTVVTAGGTPADITVSYR